MRLSETLDDFKRSMVVSGSRLPNTTEKYERIMRQFINAIGDKEIHELRIGDFGDFKYGMVMRSPGFCKLNGEAAGSARVGTNQDLLVLFHLWRIDKGLPSGIPLLQNDRVV